MIKPDLPIASEIEESLIVISEPVRSEILDTYNTNSRELYIMITVASSIALFYILYNICT